MSDDLRFDLAADGNLIVDPAFAGFAEVRNGILRVDGFRISIDTRALSHSLLPLIPGYDGDPLAPGQHDLNVLPTASGYTFISASGVSTNFSFVVTSDGRIVVDPQFAGFAEASGQTLRIKGYEVTIDSTALSHALLPLLLGWPTTTVLPPGRNPITVVPGALGYSFITASGIVADFNLMVTTDGRVTVDPRFAGFAEASGPTLTIRGYRVTLDTSALSHSLLPLLLNWRGNDLAPGRNDLTILPGAVGYSFVVASGVVADFNLMVKTDGSIAVDPRFAGFAKADGLTLKLAGYGMYLDTSELTSPVLPLLLGWTRGALQPGLNFFAVLPAANYALLPIGGRLSIMSFNLRTDGTMTIQNAPAGTTLTSDQRFCGVPDDIVTPIQIQTFGPSKGRWSHGDLTWSVDLTNVPADLGAAVVVQVLTQCFAQWQAALPEFFSFRQVPVPGNIHAAFGGPELNKNFAAPPGATKLIEGVGAHPELGNLDLNKAVSWTQDKLTTVCLHEIGHTLGLNHSDNPDSIMYPDDQGMETIDPESKDELRNIYTWKPQTPLSDRATSDRPAMAVKTHVTLTTTTSTFHMVWKGSRDDQSVYQSAFEDGAWTSQQLVNSIGSSHSPALAQFPLNDGTTSTGLIMAWTGASDDDNIYYATTTDGTNWTAQSIVPNVGSSVRPALAAFDVPVLAWKGARDDDSIYWSRLTASGWEPQRGVPGVGTSHSPALVVFQNKPYMFWKGIHDDHNVYFSSLDNAPNAQWRPQQVVQFPNPVSGSTTFTNIASDRGPAATLHGDRIMLAWKGTVGDTHIWFSLYDGNEFSGQLTVPNVGTSEGPGICNFQGFTHMAWKGLDGDNGIYWSQLASPSG